MGGGGGKTKTPELLNDNLYHKQFYRVLDILSEGPIYGVVNQAAPLNCVMLNDTPITDGVGNTSIPGVSVAWRPGTLDQSPINGFNAIESTVIVNAQVTHDTPLIRTVSDPNVTRVRLNIGVDSLVESDNESNQHNTTVMMMIDVKPSSSSTWTAVKDVSITGKISGEYLESHIINAPDEKPFDIRVRRITADSVSDLLQNDTRWSSYSEIIDDNLSYPYTAVAGAVIDHDQYADTPTRTYHLRGLIVDVPDNYDPETRTYSGLWLGGFKQAYTNNPAWLFRYLIKNDRFGLARQAGYIDVDDGALYTLSQYCDQLVDDGYGGQEPRLTLNAYVTEQKSARDLLDSIAGMFRGIALWDGQRLTVMIDAPQDPIATITNANVVDGAFTRSSIARAERYNAVVVSWTDPENGWEQTKEYVSDDELIARDGYNETTLEAFGCTSRGQAYRAGKWLIETAKREPSKFTFKMARDAIHFTPGDIIEILDNNRAGARLGGRIVANNGKVITVDKVDSEYITAGDTISLLDSDGKFKKHQITGVNGNEITLAAAPAWIRNGTVFAVSTEAAKPVLCRITSVAETENNSVYTIEAAQHDPNKQAVVDEGAIFEINSDTLNHFRVPNIENLKVVNIGSETVQCRATWETQTTTHRMTFEIRIYNADGAVVKSYETTKYSYDFYGIDAGLYTLGVRGRNDTGMKGAESIVDLVIGAPAAPVGVNWVPGVFQATVYPISKTTLTTDTAYEFYYAGENQITDPAEITTSAQYTGRGYQWTFGGMSTGHMYYVYIRTRNAFGVSDFIEASGKPTEDFDEITDFVTNEVMESEQFQELISDTSTLKGDVTDLKDTTSDLINRVQNNEEGLGVHESRINEIGVELSEQDSELTQTRARLQNVSIALLNNSVAQTTSRRTLSAQLKQSKAEITRIDEVVATEKEATAKALSELEAKISDEIQGKVTNLEQAMVTLEQATAQQISEVTASINGQSVTIEENKTAITNINSDMSATWSLKIATDNNGMKYASGISLGVTGDGANTQSQCIFLVDRFVLMTAANGTYQTPFYVTNGAMYVREAFIKDASIATAKIADAAITTAKIAQQIQSTNYASGSAGWMINKNGSAEFNNVTVRGTVYANSGKFTGALEATSFVGDVASTNFIPQASFPDQPKNDSRSVTKTYIDSSSSTLSKTVFVIIPYHLSYYQYSQSTTIKVTIDINGNSKTYNIVRSASTPQFGFTVSHCVTGITAQTVTINITEEYSNTNTGAERRPGLALVTRSSGSWL